MEEPHIEDRGKVVSVAGKTVRVEIERGGGCKTCAMHGLCFRQNTPAVFELTTELDLREGDHVSLEISPALRVTSALLIFAVPLVFLFMGYLVAARFLVESAAILASLLVSAASFFIVRICDKRMGASMDIRIGKKL